MFKTISFIMYIFYIHNQYPKNRMNSATQHQPTLSNIRKDTNERIYQRNIPTHTLQPYMNVRPLNTKYTYLPIVEPRVLHHKVPLKSYPVYNSEQVFNPGNRNAPFSGYAAAINTESELKGQIYALQKSSQAIYVPKSTSDLYQYSLVTKSPFVSGLDPHALLFKTERFEPTNPNPYDKIVGVQLWSNSTRDQFQNIPENYCPIAGGEKKRPM